MPIAPDDPIEIDVYSEQMDKIEWLSPYDDLMVRTTGGEFPNAQAEADSLE